MLTRTTLSLPLALLLTGALACNTSPDPSASSDTGTTATSSGAVTSTGPDEPPTTGPLPIGTTDATTGTTATTTTSEPGTTGTTGTTGPVDTTTDAPGTSTTDPLGTTTDPGTTTGTTGPGTTDTGDTLDTGDTSTSTGGPTELGVLSGECGLIDAMELESPSPFVFTNTIDFGITGFDEDLLTPGSHQIIEEGNLNEGSIHSEIVAYEVLARCDMATFLKGEGTIVYNNPMGKKTDLLIELNGYKVGVSVVRAIGFPKDDPYTVMQAQTILTKKLTDILASTANVAAEDAWVKQILAVIAYEPMHVDSILAAYEALDAQTRADTILLVTLTNGDDAFIY